VSTTPDTAPGEVPDELERDLGSSDRGEEDAVDQHHEPARAPGGVVLDGLGVGDHGSVPSAGEGQIRKSAARNLSRYAAVTRTISIVATPVSVVVKAIATGEVVIAAPAAPSRRC
jgi:hypothetical protein